MGKSSVSPVTAKISDEYSSKIFLWDHLAARHGGMSGMESVTCGEDRP